MIRNGMDVASVIMTGAFVWVIIKIVGKLVEIV